MTQKLFAHATAWKIPRCSEGIKEKFYLYVGPASGRISNIEAKSARLELPQRAPFPCLLSMILGHCSPKAKQDTWYRTSFKTVPSCLLVFRVIIMVNCFSFSPHSFCFHFYQAFATRPYSICPTLDKTFVQTYLQHLCYQCCQSTSRARRT